MKNRVSRALGLGGLGAVLLAAPSVVAAEPSDGEHATVPASSPPPAAKPKPTTTLSFGPIERLPPDAYPEPKVRGLVGGSLWLIPDFHGLQWPYYPKTGIGISGYGWVDTGVLQLTSGEPASGSPGLTGFPKTTKFVQQSRFVLRATPTWSDGKWFVQAQAELVAAQLANGNTSVIWSADDAWVRFGRWNLFDVLVGRFQAWEVYHYGMGLDLHTLERGGATPDPLGFLVAPIYGLTFMYERADTIGQGAIHLYPTDFLRFEVGGQFGPDLNGQNTLGVRPVGILDFGWLRLKAGLEFLNQHPVAEGAKGAKQEQGGAASVQVIVDPIIEFGANFGYAQTDTVDSMGVVQGTQNFHSFSVGGFVNARVVEDLLVGAGLHYSYLEDTDFDSTLHRNNNFDQWQPFGAVQYYLFKQLMIKAVVAYALADQNPISTLNPHVYKNEMVSGRLRLFYLF